MPKSTMCLGCKIKRASFGFEGGKKVRCKACKDEGMIDLMSKKCEACKIVCATFGVPGGKHTHCVSCKTSEMVNVKAKLCQGCNKKQPFFGLDKAKAATHCADCKNAEMTDVRSKKCIVCKNNLASFGYNEKRTHCINCKKNDMFHSGLKCINCNKKQPAFGIYGGKNTHCGDCKTSEMIDLVTKKCIECKKVAASFGYEDTKEYNYCGDCKKDGMINIKDIKRKCKQENCYMRGNKKYDGYCTFCFQHLFPDNPLCLEMNFKTFETKIRNVLIENNLEFTHDKPIHHSGCDCSSRRRVDFWKIIGNTILAIEVDENQHKDYNKKDEEIRYDDLFMHFSGKWIFIRFNPNKFKKGSAVFNPRMETRTPRLLAEINKHIERIHKEENSELVEIHHLFFNSDESFVFPYRN